MSSAGSATLGYSPFDKSVIADPYPWYRRLRDEQPLYHQPNLDLWVLSRYADVRRAARDHTRLSSAEGITFSRAPTPMMITMDPPAHTRLRRIVTREFTPRGVDRWQTLVERRARALIDPLVEAGGGDFVGTVAAPLPVMVVADLLGVPPEDHARFRTWSDAIVEGFALAGGLSGDDVRAQGVIDAVLALRAYLMPFVERRRAEPGDDLLSLLVKPTEDDALTDEEVFWFFHLLLVAGNETTSSLLGNLLMAFAERPDQWELLRDAPDLAGAAVEEGLRFDAPIQGFCRTAVEDISFEGGTVPADGRVLLLFGSANHDPGRFDRPDEFDVRRRVDEHLAFGTGIHLCLGSGLARLEAETVLGHLVRSVRRIELGGEPARTDNPSLRGMARLPVALI